MRLFKFSTVFFLTIKALYAAGVVNVYVWGGEIPRSIIQQFERETGIEVHFSTYDSNETMYAKLKASSKNLYDVILPSSYYVERMQKQGMLTKLDHNKLHNLKNLQAEFTQHAYDPGNQYSIPLVWGATGIFYNSQWAPPQTSWNQLWERTWRNKLLALDDSRDMFSIAMISLGFQPNDEKPEHIKEAYEKLQRLVPNIKLFASDALTTLMIDEEVMIGTAWNGDVYKAQQENSKVQFSYPSEGYVVWIDCLAIPNNPPNREEAYRFIDFLLRAQSAAAISLEAARAVTNLEGIKLLPPALRNNAILYPDSATLKRSYVQRDVSDQALELYNQYWERLKLAF